MLNTIQDIEGKAHIKRQQGSKEEEKEEEAQEEAQGVTVQRVEGLLREERTRSLVPGS